MRDVESHCQRSRQFMTHGRM